MVYFIRILGGGISTFTYYLMGRIFGAGIISYTYYLLTIILQKLCFPMIRIQSKIADNCPAALNQKKNLQLTMIYIERKEVTKL